MEENTISYTVSINGQKAVDIGYAFQKGNCYRGITVNGEQLAQLEVVLDEEGEYNGYPIKWVDVSYIKESNIDVVINELSSMGFVGCKAVLTEDHYDGCICEQKEIREFIIPEPAQDREHFVKHGRMEYTRHEHEFHIAYNESGKFWFANGERTFRSKTIDELLYRIDEWCDWLDGLGTPTEDEEETEENPDRYHDIETDEITTDCELWAEYDKSEERHGMSFGQYKNNCMTYNGGTLEKI